MKSVHQDQTGPAKEVAAHEKMVETPSIKQGGAILP
jgi:hypothetical protein